MIFFSTGDFGNKNFLIMEKSKIESYNDQYISYLQNNKIYDDCYGFIVPLPSGDDTSIETFLNSRVRYLINDLLRENINVFWSASNFSALSKGIDNESDIIEISYKKGDFIIPFTGDINKDSLIISVIYDYNKTSEIEDDDQLKIPVYKIINEFSVDTYKLVEPKIVQHLGTPTRYGWPVFLFIVEDGGFLDIEFLLDNETSQLLNNNDFNVLLWPYNPNPGRSSEVAKSVFNKDATNAMRNFVRNGGGFIGSCYGAQVGSAGNLIPIPIFSLRYAYNPDLTFKIPFISLSISDTLVRQKRVFDHFLYVTTLQLENTNHPMSYGINNTIQEFFNGPIFMWLGKNSENLATIKKIQSEKNHSVSPIFEKNVIGTPGWVDSKFGNGKVILFSGHPEIVNNISLLLERFELDGDPYYGRRIIHNALFYTTSENLKNTEIAINYPLTYIEELGENTVDLFIPSNNESEFDSIKLRISQLNKDISILRNISVDQSELFCELFNENIISKFNILYPVKYVYYYCTFFNNYCNTTLNNIEKIDNIYPLLYEYNESIKYRLDDLIIELSERLNKSESLLVNIIDIANDLKDDLINKKTVLQKLQIISDARYMLRSYEIGLKYVPQMHLQSLKFLRYCWYNYELNIAQNTEL